MPRIVRPRALWIAALLLCGGAITVAALAVLAAPGLRAAPTVQQGTGPSDCVISGTKRAAPQQVLFGEPISITMALEAVCPREPVHLVLVLDGSDAMSSGALQDLRRAGRDLVQDLALDDHPERQLGVVVYNDEATTVCQLTNDVRIAQRCFDRLTSTGGRDIGAAIEEGRRVLVSGRFGAPPDTREVMVLLAAGEDDQGCANVSSNAGRTKSQNVQLATICLGQGCDAQCMSQAASNRRLYRKADRSGELRQALPALLEAAAPASAELAAAALVDPLGAQVALVPGSAMPPATTLGRDDRRPAWRFSTVPESGITVTLAVTPTAAGFVTTNAGATWSITDTAGLTATLRLPDPRVLVLGGPGPAATATSAPTSTATSTVGPATPTFTALPPSTGTATIAPSATATTTGTATIVPTPTATTTPTDLPTTSTTTPTPTPVDGGGGTGVPPMTATPTPDPAGATSTPTPDPAGGTPTPDPAGGTASPTPAPTGPPAPIYLPYLDRAAYLGADPEAVAGVRLVTVLLFERHADTTGDPRGTVRALRQLAQGLIFAPDGAPRRIGLVSIGGVAVACPPTADIEAFEACAERALAAGPAVGGDLAGGLRAAHAMLADAAAGAADDPASAVVAIAVKERPAGCDAALAERDRLRDGGTRLITLCPGDGCERTCLRDVASGRADYLVMQSFAWLLPTLEGVLQRLLSMGAP